MKLSPSIKEQILEIVIAVDRGEWLGKGGDEAATEAILRIIESDVIGEDDPLVPHVEYKTGDLIVVRKEPAQNALRESQREKLK